MAYSNLFSGLLIQTCLVYRRQQVDGKDKTDAYGQPTRDQVLVAEYPCRCSTARGGRTMNDRSTDVVETTHELFLESNAVLYEDDVVSVVQPNGDPTTGPFVVQRAVVKLVRPIIDGVQLHHIEADLQMQRGATGVDLPNG